jgi:predicted MFS family arabinose efflux permease
MASIRAADAMLPALGAGFGRSVAEAAGAVTGFALAYGLMQLVWGPLGDAAGKLRVIVWAAVAASFGSLACAVAPTLPALVAARFATGACCAAIIPLSIAYLGDAVAEHERQAALARLASGTLTGLIAGQLLGGLSADTVGWRGGFAALALTFAVAAWRVQVARGYATAPPGVPARLAATMTAYATVLRSPGAARVLATGFAEGALMFAALAFVPTWLHQRTGLPLSAAGALLALVGVGGLLFTQTARRWIGALGQAGLLAWGPVGIALGFGALVGLVALHAPAPPAWAWAAAGAACVLAGFGFNAMHNSLQMLATQMAPAARGTAVGLFAVSLFLGQSLGVALAAQVGPQVGFGPVIVASGTLMVALGAALAAALRRHPPPGEPGR